MPSPRSAFFLPLFPLLLANIDLRINRKATNKLMAGPYLEDPVRHLAEHHLDLRTERRKKFPAGFMSSMSVFYANHLLLSIILFFGFEPSLDGGGAFGHGQGV